MKEIRQRDYDALIVLCDEQRRKIALQAAEIERLNRKVKKMQVTIDELVVQEGDKVYYEYGQE
jgi:hypothetical protein